MKLALCDDLWIAIFDFVDNIKYIIRLKIALGLKFSQFSFDKRLFWLTIAQRFFGTNIVHWNEYLRRVNFSAANGSIPLLISGLFSPKKCSRSGCFKNFVEASNEFGSCIYHPGKKKSSGYLSCCRQRSFQSMGCTKGYHDSLFHSIVFCTRSSESVQEDILPALAMATRDSSRSRDSVVKETFRLPMLRAAYS